MSAASARRTVAALTALALVAGLSLEMAPAMADTAPPAGVSATVSTDPLPTTQIDGVAWSQVIVGNTVFVGGSFTTARPAGAAPGVNTVPRANLLAYDLRSGVLLPSFAPRVNGEVRSVAASPDGKRLYIAGLFTSINGVARSRVAAFDAVSGALVSSFAPAVNSTVEVVKATNSTVYIGGNFTSIGSAARTRVGALNAADGAVLPFAASALGGRVRGIAVSPDQTKVVLAGAFTTLNGSGTPGYGMGAVNASTGSSLPWAVDSKVRNGGTDAAIYSLTSDADSVYGSGYVYGAGGNLEGVFRADWKTGALIWVEDCHGDTYGVTVTGNTVYTAGHPHYCGNSGGFPQTSPWTFQRAMAWTKAPSGRTATREPYGYYNWAGTPVPTLLNWWPDFNVGTFTGASQGP